MQEYIEKLKKKFNYDKSLLSFLEHLIPCMIN